LWWQEKHRWRQRSGKEPLPKRKGKPIKTKNPIAPTASPNTLAGRLGTAGAAKLLTLPTVAQARDFNYTSSLVAKLGASPAAEILKGQRPF
jgi:hypothetical protein